MSKDKWKNAPEDAEFYAGEAFCKEVDGLVYCHGSNSKRWMLSDANIFHLKNLDDYEERPLKPTTGKADNVRRSTIGKAETKDGSKYHRAIIGLCGKAVVVDVYRVLDAFDTGSAEIDHAVKKLLNAGLRGHKDELTDLYNAIESIKARISLIKQKQVIREYNHESNN